MSRKKWIVSPCDRDVASRLAESCGVDPFTAYLLCSRGMTDEFEVESFLFDTDLIDPFTLPDMDKACDRIEKALENNEKITIFGDFDADGVTSTAILYSYLLSQGASVDYYIPSRADEGYGMNNGAVDTLKARGTQLIITVDNGISALEEIKYSKELGIDVVVTDHHKAGETLPDAVAIVDPHREDCYCEFREWAGVGVAFKLISALQGSEGYDILEQYGDIIALGTVADIVALKGENRILVRSGLAYMNSAFNEGTLRPGISELINISGAVGEINSSVLAFRLAPRINASGRMGSAERALKLLLAETTEEARELAEIISEANLERQTIEAEITEAAIDYIENNPNVKYSKVLVVGGENWHQGVIGIVASRIVEKYGKPCLVLSKNGETSRGSCRSIEGFSLYDALSYCSDCLVQFGGHVLAAGFTIETSRIEEFRLKINEYADTLERAVPAVYIDCKLNPSAINLDIIDALEILEPFGAENPQPLFGLYNMELIGYQPVSNGKHMRVTVRKKGVSVGAIIFNVAPKDFPYAIGDKIDLAVRLSLNEYMGKKKVNVQIKNIKLSGTDDEKIIKTEYDYEAFCSGKEMSENGKNILNISRDFCVTIYKFIKANNGWNHSIEMMCYRLNLPLENILNCKIALDVLTELGIINYSDGIYTLPKANVKTSLENSGVFRRALEKSSN